MAAKNERLKEQELLDFLEHMALFSDKMTLRQAVEAYRGPSQRAQAFQRKVSRMLGTGMVLSEALRRSGCGLTPLEVSLIASGEESGKIAEALREVTDTRREKQEMRAKLKSSLIMPCITLTVGLVVSMYMLFVIIPKYEAMFLKTMSWDRIPETSRAIFTAARFARSHVVHIFGGIGGVLFLFLRFGDPWSLPVVKVVARYGILYTLFINMSLLVRGGLTTQVALETVAKSLPASKLYRSIRAGLSTVLRNVARGESIPSAVSRVKYFGEETALFFAMATESGNYDVAMETACKKFKYLFMTNLDTAVRIANPVVFIITSAMVGSMVVAMYFPIFESITAVTGG